MMFAKTFCKPGAYMCVVPLGLRATLQYNSKGVLEKVIQGYEDDGEPLSKELFNQLVHSATVPVSIHLKGGTTWVQGVFYTNKEFNSPGNLPECIENEIISDMQNCISSYTFYAGNITSLAASFQSIRTITNWLSMSSFNVLVGHILPANITDKVLNSILTNKLYFPFKYPLISGVMIWEGNHFHYVDCNLSQFTANKVVKEVDENGYIKGHVYNKEGECCISAPFSDIANYDIQTSSNVIYDNTTNKILYAIQTDNKKRDARGKVIECTICGKRIVLPTGGPITCDDPHCLSLQYPNVRHMLKVLDLPELTFDKYVKYVKKGEILCITDVLLLPEYSECKLELTLHKCLEAITPITICSDSNFFTIVSFRCSESIKTLKYYLDNPNRLKIELGINTLECNRWINWLEDSYNSKLIENIIECPQVTVVKSNQLFEGAPIFRDKVIAVTGKFKHGDLSEIAGILQSYSARVVTSVDDTVGCLVVGSFKENIDGKCIKAAKELNIPMFEEDAFFKEYEIDSDLAQNLL